MSSLINIECIWNVYGMFTEKQLDGVNQWPMIRSGKPSRRTEFVYEIDKSRPVSAIR